MKCNDIKELLPLYSGGEIDKEQYPIIENHIQVCNTCRDELNKYRDISNILSGFKEGCANEGLWEDMWLGIKEGIKREKKNTRILRFSAVLELAASFIIGIGIGYFCYLFLVEVPQERGAISKIDKSTDTTDSDFQSTVADYDPLEKIHRVTGMNVSAVDDNLVRELSLPNQTRGMFVLNIQNGSVAEEVGVRPGDIIIKYEYLPIRKLDLEGHCIYSLETKLKILRGGKIFEYKIPLAITTKGVILRDIRNRER